ncbi:MAG: O-acetyl-ADP-ribose deacetylase [Pyrinomonadaceae bacterium]|nr:O-acetyl-ADP-ribose deacetylase [Pyrinomonadaceae bacterium]
MTAEFLNGRILVRSGDLTAEDIDAIVNAANWTLLGGGGVDGAIHAAGGSEIYDACKEIRETTLPDGLPTGQAVITTGGRLPAKYVIHTVGPIFGRNDGRDAELLADCYINSIALAAEHSLRTIAFPSISTGAYGYPKHLAAGVASTAIASALEKHGAIEEVRLVLFSEGDAKIFIKHAEF